MYKSTSTRLTVKFVTLWQTYQASLLVHKSLLPRLILESSVLPIFGLSFKTIRVTMLAVLNLTNLEHWSFFRYPLEPVNSTQGQT